MATLPDILDLPRAEQLQPSTRLLSLDVFRGFIIAAMILVTNPGTYSARYAPLCHSDWTGPTATDIISPAFLMMIGVAIPFSFESRLARGARQGQLLLHVLYRTALLLLLGLLLNGFPDFDLHTLRIPGILQHIALCYLGASLLYLAVARIVNVQADRPENRASRLNLVLAAVAIALLAVYGALLKYLPVPGFGPGRFDSLGSLPAYVDRVLFGVRHLWPYGTTPGYGVTFDPDGLLSILSGIAILLIGVLAGGWLRMKHTHQRKVLVLAAAAVCLILAGYELGPWTPLVKKLWTSTFALFSSGVALMVFCCLYILFDMRRGRWGSQAALVFGTNAIFAFALSTVLTTLSDRLHLASANGESTSLHNWVYQHGFATWLQPINASLAYAIAMVLLNLALVYPLYRKRIFLRL